MGRRRLNCKIFLFSGSRTSPGGHAQPLRQAGFAGGRLAQAAGQFRQVIERDPASVTVTADPAIACFCQAIPFQSQTAEARYNLEQALFYRSDRGGAPA